MLYSRKSLLRTLLSKIFVEFDIFMRLERNWTPIHIQQHLLAVYSSFADELKRWLLVKLGNGVRG